MELPPSFQSVDPHPVSDASYMVPDGLLLDVEHVRNFLVCEPKDDLFTDLSLTVGEVYNTSNRH